jgi:hypothetical protein
MFHVHCYMFGQTSDACWPLQQRCTQPFRQFDTEQNTQPDISLLLIVSCCRGVLLLWKSQTDLSCRLSAWKLKVDTWVFAVLIRSS